MQTERNIVKDRPDTPEAAQTTGPRPGALQRGPSLADALAARLKDEIGEGRLQSGERLPSEHEMSETYGVSRPTVREAIGRLKHDGLVVTRQGSGVFVADPRASSVFRLDIADFGDKDDIQSIIELLMAVEGAATQLAAERRTPAELAEIRARLNAVQQAIDRGEPGVDEDMAFHRAIIDATGNAYFRDLSDFLERRVRHFIRMARSNTARHAGLTQAVQTEHIAIFEAIEKQQRVEARNAAERHLRNAAKRLTLYMLAE
jgi:GntR family transcriptional repressor for pyruvate dehydrogenase complex